MRAIYTPKKNALPSNPDRIDFGSRLQVRQSIDAVLGRLTSVAAYSDYLYYSPPGLFHCGRDPYRLARYVFSGPAAGDQPVKIGVFAAINGDEPEGTAALVELLLCLHLDPERARGYQIFVYPICNPTGFEDGTRLTRGGHDLQRELWNGSRQPEAYYLERELGVLQFHGVVNLRSVEENTGIHFHTKSATLQEALVEPALEAAGKILSRDKGREGMRIIQAATVGPNRYEWGLGNPAELNPAPFEIILETPRKAPPELQSRAMVAALNRIVEEYRPFLATQQNL